MKYLPPQQRCMQNFAPQKCAHKHLSANIPIKIIFQSPKLGSIKKKKITAWSTNKLICKNAYQPGSKTGEHKLLREDIDKNTVLSMFKIIIKIEDVCLQAET